jgi:putative phosphoesterase
MQIAVFSDSHDNIRKVDEALKAAEKADMFVHCGDLCSPFVVKRLGEAAEGRPLHIVWGNNDGDVLLMCKVAAGFQGIEFHGEFAELTIDGTRIAVNHYPQIARPLAASGFYDLVCYGHDHTAVSEQIGDCALLNPGELFGLYGKTTFAWFDTTSKAVEFVELA